MLSGRTKKITSTCIKTALVLLCFGYLYFKLSVSDLNELWLDAETVFSKTQSFYLLFFTVILMGFNWSLEAIKWQRLIAPLEKITFTDSLKSVLAGVSISLVTPNRAGEFAGKIFYLKQANKPDAMLRSMVGSLSQVLVTLCFGLLSLHYYLYEIKNFENFKILTFILILLTIALSCYLFFDIKSIAQNWKRGNFIRKIVPYQDATFTITKSELAGITALSLLRYVLFSIQFYFILLIFDLPSGFFSSMLLISLYFFFISLIPTYALTELGIRGSVAIALFCTQQINCTAVFTSSLLLWLINLAFPAIIGSVFVFQLRFFKSEND